MHLSLPALGVWLYLTRASASPANPYSAFTDPSNDWSTQTTIDFPNSTAFVNATERWNSFDPPTYSVAITPATDVDVAKAVRSSPSFLAFGTSNLI
jgi:hypothetical protein